MKLDRLDRRIFRLGDTRQHFERFVFQPERHFPRHGDQLDGQARQRSKGLVEPASSDNLQNIAQIARWMPAPLDADTQTFQLIKSGNYVLGPAMGALTDMPDRFTLVRARSGLNRKSRR